MDSHDIRRAHLRRLVASTEGGQKEFARLVGREPNQISQLLGSKNMGPNIARSIESHLGLERGSLDREQPLRQEKSAGVEDGKGGYKSDRTLRRDQLELLEMYELLSSDDRARLRAIGGALAKHPTHKKTGNGD